MLILNWWMFVSGLLYIAAGVDHMIRGKPEYAVMIWCYAITGCILATK